MRGVGDAAPYNKNRGAGLIALRPVQWVLCFFTSLAFQAAYDQDELVFFSVPYDDGFTATINGSPAAIEKVDNGLMAVYVPAGENEIEFIYHTPGLHTSAVVSAIAIVVYAGYLGVLWRKKRKAL